ncbi:MAG TPA: hypothetical protein VI362_06425 [Ignavibacteriaceae bacterium]|nr:hypothetical protein [Ignavibacteriaceae bacterium]
MFFRKKTNIRKPFFHRIINAFIYAVVGLIFLLLLVFGFTQTKTFREWLRETVIEEVNASTNGKLEIERIDGTILTSLILNNTVYILNQDTLLRAEKIELRTSPLKIIFKIIYIRKLELTNAHIAVYKDNSGELNISKITTPSVEETVPEDTVSSGFTFKIEVAELSLKNVDVIIQSETKRNSSEYYDHPDFDDFRLRNINLNLYAFADLEGQEFELNIHHFQVTPNLKNFAFENFSADVLLVRDEAWIKDLKLKTAASEITLNTAVSGYSLLGENENRKIEDAQIKLELTANNFNFDDLSTFIDATDLLKGNISTEIRIAGSLTELHLNQLLVVGDSTRLDGSGMLKNITSGEDMDIDVRFVNSFVNQKFSNSLLHTIELPEYEQLGLLKIDTLYFTGKPLNFNSGINLTTDKGAVKLIADLNLEKEDLVYNIKFSTNDLDLNPFINIPTNLNCNGSISGAGISPETMQSELIIVAENSTLFGSSLQNLNFSAKVLEGEINSQLNFESNNSTGIIAANMMMNNFENPNYNFKADIKGLDLSLYNQNPSMKSDLNFITIGEGENFSPEILNLFLTLEVDNSKINGFIIESTSLIADIRGDSSSRVVNVISDVADITLTGKFKLEDLVSLIDIETTLITEAIKNKMDEIHPQESLVDNRYFASNADIIYPEITDEILNTELNLNYLIEFKDFELLSLFLGNTDIEIDGEINGQINTFPDSLSVILNAEIEYFKFWDESDLIYLSELILFVSLNDKISDPTLNNFNAETSLTGKRIFFGSELSGLDFNFKIENTNAELRLSALVEDNAAFEISGGMIFDENTLEILLDKLYLSYNNYELTNKGNIDLNYSNKNIEFRKFTLTHNPGDFDISGSVSLTGEENLTVQFSNFRLRDIGTKLLGFTERKSPDAIFNLNAEYKGNALSPVAYMNFSLDSVNFNGLHLGSFYGNFNYLNETIGIGAYFNEQSGAQNIPKLKIFGSVPMNLTMNGQEMLINNREINVQFVSDKFNIQAFNAALPMLNKLNGLLEADVSFLGTFNDLISSGNIKLSTGSFVLAQNNLEYNFGFDINFQNNEVTLEDMYLANSTNTKDGGTLQGRGHLTHQNFAPQTAEFSLGGDLKLLDKESKASSPTLFGDLAIRTIGDVVFILNENQSQLIANISIKRGSNLTYSPIQSAFSNENNKFKYEFVKVESIVQQDKLIDSLIVISESTKEAQKPSSGVPFDLDINISIEDEIKTVFVLSREFKQNLTAYLGGNFEYILINKEPTARGELKLLEGSKLEFIKSFQAQGSIQFLGEIDNPFLDITADYQSYYNPDTLRSSSSEFEVLIQIKLEGPVKNLSTNFIRNEENISVYKRPSGRGEFELDATKDASDAMMFIIIGKFPDDATTQETNLAVSTAAALAGSIVGGFLNERLGDYVRSFQVSQVGEETKFSLVGKAGDFKYEIGGTSQMFQDLSRANVKIEYPIPITPGLIVRLERREPIFESSTASEMINELGLKYSFEF